MTETEAPESAPAVSTPKKAKSPKKKTAVKKASHPPTSQMVNAAIASLKERGGSSLAAIKKYISSTYKVDATKMAPFIKKYLVSAVKAGSLTQTKGQGANGSFKLVAASKGEAKKAAPAKKKPVAAKPKKEVKKVEKKPKATTKAKKTTKPPTKPKAPKAKKATAKSPAKPKAAKPKKAVAKKPAAKKATPKKK